MKGLILKCDVSYHTRAALSISDAQSCMAEQIRLKKKVVKVLFFILNLDAEGRCRLMR
jgi:hypothetical protein